MTFQDIKAGDQIIVAGRVLVVERVTATQIVAGNLRVVRETGKVVGRSCYAEIATPERLARVAEYAAATLVRADLMITAALLLSSGRPGPLSAALADAGVE